jgi:glutamate-1-semialdehyde 2,1-aminomutase
VLEAIQAQLGKGMHLAAANELEVEWARRIQEMVPSAERVRFTSSGTEATQLAMRLARASAGKSRIVRFQSHFHGWHDQVAFGVNDHLDGTPSIGVLQQVADNTSLVPPNDVAAVERVLRSGDVAAVMIEPTGSSSGAVPTPPEVLGALREITKKAGVLLIFDEVVTCFRVSRGGAQELYGVIPDLTTMAKIVAGGMPGGAVGGRKDILDWLDFEAAAAAGRERISHQGTHNAHPLSAAAGITTLDIIRESDACAKASATGATLRAGMNEVLQEEGVPWAIYGEHSFFHIYTNPQNQPVTPTAFDAGTITIESLKGKDEAMLGKMRLAMLVNGVDLKGWRGGIVSAVHTQADVALTLEAWRKSLRALKEEGALAQSRPTASTPRTPR